MLLLHHPYHYLLTLLHHLLPLSFSLRPEMKTSSARLPFFDLTLLSTLKEARTGKEGARKEGKVRGKGQEGDDALLSAKGSWKRRLR
ncbi:hypothetical protein E2C01_097969 [Portunus trituberculatus]|uniref:Uncharacterized protein n=1 Tax=Portunus trituberculatus TaxID=210409 RepID=A0A5B7K007_PORTR|nr:hypothetical protein [Portunus trituberculatus]